MSLTTFSKNPLRRPFPNRLFGRELVFGHARTALFVFAALLFLRPLGMDFGANAVLISLGYGLVIFLVAVAYSYLTERFLGWQRSGPQWTLGRWLLDCGLLLFCTAIVVYLYHNLLVDWQSFNLFALAAVAIPTVLIGLLPIGFSGMFIQLRAERDHQQTAGYITRVTGQRQRLREASQRPPDMQPTPKLVQLTEQLALDPMNILLCESRQDDLRMVYYREGQIVEESLAADLTRVEEALEGTPVLRCHPSFLVGTTHVTSARGNAQGLRLSLSGIEEEVPVSRKYVASVRNELLG